jgi:short-subunit dehydrogenase
MKNALVTGGSEGIGLEIARLLALEGHKIMLVARSEEKLTAAVKSLTGQSHSFMSADLSKKEHVDAIARHIAQEHYDVLVNCAGIGMFGRFEDLPVSEQVAMMNLNMVGLTVLSHSYLKNAREDDSLVNIASTLSTTTFPGLAVYAGTKAYVQNFSESLWWEAKKKGVYVLGFCPGVTDTNFYAASNGSASTFPKFITQTPAAVAKEMLAALKRRRKPKAVSGSVNRGMLFFHRFLSRRSIVNMMGSFSPLAKK